MWLSRILNYISLVDTWPIDMKCLSLKRCPHIFSYATHLPNKKNQTYLIQVKMHNAAKTWNGIAFAAPCQCVITLRNNFICADHLPTIGPWFKFDQVGLLLIKTVWFQAFSPWRIAAQRMFGSKILIFDIRVAWRGCALRYQRHWTIQTVKSELFPILRSF